MIEYSKYYKTFSNVLTIRTVSAEYLVVMKLMAGRRYKNDLSDIIGILLEQRDRKKEISLECIKKAAEELYDGYENLPEDSRIFIEEVYHNSDLETLYANVRKEEKKSRELLLEFDEDYPYVLNGDNVMDILKTTKSRRDNAQ